MPQKCTDGRGCNNWIGWEYSHTLHWNGTQKYCSTACAGFLPMPHDDIVDGVYPTAWRWSGAHPW